MIQQLCMELYQDFLRDLAQTDVLIPLSEDSLTGYGIGLAVAGYYPIHVHQRTDFLLLCCNQLINMAAKIKYLSNGRLNCPFVVRAITGRSWGQGSQHSQSFHSCLPTYPGSEYSRPLLHKIPQCLSECLFGSSPYRNRA